MPSRSFSSGGGVRNLSGLALHDRRDPRFALNVFLSALFAFASWMAPAVAADIQMERLNGSPEKTLITIRGDIVSGDDRRFIDLALGARGGMVVFTSEGGNLVAALEIGKAIRLKNLITYVSDNRVCASACALAWLGGRTRLASSTARIGFHAAYTEANGAKVPTGIGNALIGAYLSQLGFSQDAIIFVTSASPDAITWLKSDKARQIGIDVGEFDLDSGSAKGSNDAAQPRAQSPTPMTSDAPILSPGAFVGHGDWLQIFSRPNLAEAVEIAREYEKRFTNVVVFRYANGWHAVLIGPFTAGTGAALRDSLKTTGAIPMDSLVTRGERFVQLAYGRMTAPR